MDKQILILGAGAIGSYLGGSLALKGHQVTFLEREKDIPTLQKQGIMMEEKGEKKTVSSTTFTGSLDQALTHQPDLIILAVKTYHLDSLLTDLLTFKEDLPPLLCLQNGVENEDRLANFIGKELIIPGTVTSAVESLSKGNIIVSKKRGMGIAGDHSLVPELVRHFQDAGIECWHYQNPADMKWSKLLTNLLGNASSAILNLSPSQIYSDPALYRVELDQVREALNVMEYLGIKAVNLPGVPVKILAAVIKYLPNWLSQPVLSRMIGSGRGDKMPSFHIDLYSGKTESEVNHLNGAVVRAGEKSLIPTPVNLFLTVTLLSLINREIPLEMYAQGQEGFLSQLADCKVETRSAK